MFGECCLVTSSGVAYELPRFDLPHGGSRVTSAALNLLRHNVVRAASPRLHSLRS